VYDKGRCNECKERSEIACTLHDLTKSILLCKITTSPGIFGAICDCESFAKLFDG